MTPADKPQETVGEEIGAAKRSSLNCVSNGDLRVAMEAWSNRPNQSKKDDFAGFVINHLLDGMVVLRVEVQALKERGEKLEAVAKAALEGPCRHTADTLAALAVNNIECPLCKALAALEPRA